MFASDEENVTSHDNRVGWYLSVKVAHVTASHVQIVKYLISQHLEVRVRLGWVYCYRDCSVCDSLLRGLS